jgi:hypothetical protein
LSLFTSRAPRRACKCPPFFHPSDELPLLPLSLRWFRNFCHTCQASTFFSCRPRYRYFGAQSGPCGSKRRTPVSCVSGAPASPMTHFLGPSPPQDSTIKTELYATQLENPRSSTSSGALFWRGAASASGIEGISVSRQRSPELLRRISNVSTGRRKEAKRGSLSRRSENEQATAAFSGYVRICWWHPDWRVEERGGTGSCPAPACSAPSHMQPTCVEKPAGRITAAIHWT